MKVVEVELSEWDSITKKLKECMKAVKALNKEIEEYNSLAKKNNIKDAENE